jgi:predicted nuclease of restriction endonuclease-like (RecB) superfamily
MTEKNKPYFVTSKNFHGDKDYTEWLKDIKSRYLNIRNRVALQANYGALEFNWLLGRDIVLQKAESRWGAGVVNQLCLDLKAAFPDVRGFSARNLYYMKEWYEFYMADEERKQILHQLGAKLQEAKNQNPIKLHQLGAEIVSADKISSIIESNGMLPIFGIIPWKHHLVITSKCKSINEAFYYITRTIDEGLSKRELEDIIDANDFNKYGHAITNFSTQLPTQQSQLAINVLKDPYRLDFLTLEKGYNERDLESAIAKDITRFLLELGSGFTFVGRQPEFVVGNEGYFPDLLFYHIRLRCYVVIELKVVDFKPEFAGKLNFYVAACNKLLRQPEDNPTIGLLLCKSKDQTKVEWAFDSIQNPMGVATYEGIKVKDKLPSVEDLRKRLDMVEKELREYKENEASEKEGTNTSNLTKP